MYLLALLITFVLVFIFEQIAFAQRGKESRAMNNNVKLWFISRSASEASSSLLAFSSSNIYLTSDFPPISGLHPRVGDVTIIQWELFPCGPWCRVSKGSSQTQPRVLGVQHPLLFWIIFHLWMCSFQRCLDESLLYPAGAPGSFPSFQGQLDRFSFTRYKEREKKKQFSTGESSYPYVILFSHHPFLIFMSSLNLPIGPKLLLVSQLRDFQVLIFFAF